MSKARGIVHSMELAYAGIRVRDMGRSLSFYTKVMGLKVTIRGSMSHGGRFVGLKDPRTGQRLELNWYPRGSRYYTAYERGEELDHLGFECEDVHKAYKRLISRGARSAVKPFEDDGWVLAFVKDPDGIWIELLSKAQKKRARQ